jgi:hypothetical protein
MRGIPEYRAYISGYIREHIPGSDPLRGRRNLLGWSRSRECLISTEESHWVFHPKVMGLGRLLWLGFRSDKQMSRQAVRKSDLREHPNIRLPFASASCRVAEQSLRVHAYAYRCWP